MIDQVQHFWSDCHMDDAVRAFGVQATDADAFAKLGQVQQADVLSALALARLLLAPPAVPSIRLRVFRTGDLPMIVARQAILYAAEQGWGRGLEANAAQTVASFLRKYNTERERGWIAELEGVMAGSVLLSDEGDGVARLRLLYVEPFARGHGIGNQLVAACVGFATDLGYNAIVLWTHTVLESARRLYARHGFTIVETAMHREFGTPVQGETWRKQL